MKTWFKILSYLVGSLLSGFAANLAADAAGHDSRAGYPFPDVWGAVLFIVCAILSPIACLLLGAVAELFFPNLERRETVLFPVKMLVVAPLLAAAIGSGAQFKEHRKITSRYEFEAIQKRSYEGYAAQVRSDPGIIIREKWYEEPTPPWGPELSARKMVFHDSFDPKHIDTPYTVEQLREICRIAPEARQLVVEHPNCPPSLIEELWGEILNSGRDSSKKAMILHPSTPRHLLERYVEERGVPKDKPNTWLDKLVIKRLQTNAP